MINVTKDFSNKSLIIEKQVSAPLSKVWRAWTTAERLARWWGPKRWPAKTTSFDFREGGHWHYSLTGPQGVEV